MISCTLYDLLERCAERGYSFAEVAPCIVSRDGDALTVDESHEAYPRTNRRPPAPAGGPGSELKKLLGGFPFFITETAGCSCNATARTMDEWGADGCAMPDRMAWIVDRLRMEAERRKLPFVEAAARLLVRRAIAKARWTAAGSGAGS